MKKQTIGFAALAMLQKILSLSCFLIAAGTLNCLRGWIYFILYLTVMAATLAVLLHRNPDALSFPEKGAEKAAGADITLRNFCSPLAFYGIYIIAGLEIRFHWSLVPQPVIAAGLILSLIANLLMSWALLSNKYYESDTPMLKDTQPTVCSSGPYRFVRHPGYLFMIFWAVTVAMIFGWATGIMSALIILLLILRTYYEDQSLMASFPGYSSYARQVKYRLIPYIW
ncbi:isoprenylcysteine carboxylmethyltransferase family protein [Eubacterium sp. 1001713B170207_170306_E7]|uniref:methyltransferase family protein n=1 Tax=Eubacterium sp. 1001713B170207_170306_E7 TaxID=2787097 RepID=UPI00189932A6|nr:isoprenylcysteine carboxylmethyltransferase family protein [Eubacterium sp. 1001713B170207_170306_E7]